MKMQLLLDVISVKNTSSLFTKTMKIHKNYKELTVNPKFKRKWIDNKKMNKSDDMLKSQGQGSLPKQKLLW